MSSIAQIQVLRNENTLQRREVMTHTRGVSVVGNTAPRGASGRTGDCAAFGIYLLSDFALAPRSRLSKLIAMLATSHTVIARMEIKLMHRITTVYSTAFTEAAGAVAGCWQIDRCSF